MTWRDEIRPLVAAIIADVGRDDMRALRRALIDRRPHWVKYCYHQTKIWRDEVNQQLGIKAQRKAAERAKAEAADDRPRLFD